MAQINSIEDRAEMIRRCFLLVLVSLAGTIASCLLLGIGLYWKGAAVAAVILFVLAMICLLAGTIHYIREVVHGAEFGTERGTRFAVHGPRRSTRDSSPQSTLSGSFNVSRFAYPTRINGDLRVWSHPQNPLAHHRLRYFSTSK